MFECPCPSPPAQFLQPSLWTQELTQLLQLNTSHQQNGSFERGFQYKQRFDPFVLSVARQQLEA